MDDKVAYWASVILGALALLLLITNVALINSNRTIQMEISRRQNIISNGVSLSQLNQGLVQALADAAVKNDDKEIRDLLAGQGITIKPNASANSAADASAKSETKKK
jgi:hypothetical protein